MDAGDPKLIINAADECDLCFYREGQHYLLLQETCDMLELTEVFYGRRNIKVLVHALEQSSGSED